MRKSKSKYKNNKVELDGVTFESELEAKYYKHLKKMKEMGEVVNFELQPRITLLEGFEKNGKKFRPIYYLADFKVEYANGEKEVVDIKGMVTKDFAIKRKLFEKQYAESLKLITFSNIDGGWIEHDELKKKRRERKKEREKGR